MESKDTNHKKDIYAENKWDFYEAEIEQAHFEWPALSTESPDKAKKDCIEYLNQIFQGEFTLKSFKFKVREDRI